MRPHWVPAQTPHYRQSGQLTPESALWRNAPYFSLPKVKSKVIFNALVIANPVACHHPSSVFPAEEQQEPPPGKTISPWLVFWHQERSTTPTPRGDQLDHVRKSLHFSSGNRFQNGRTCSTPSRCESLGTFLNLPKASLSRSAKQSAYLLALLRTREDIAD